MNEQIENLVNICWDDAKDELDYIKFASLIVKSCADAADMAYEADCDSPGDYVGEQLGFGQEEGIANWRKM